VSVQGCRSSQRWPPAPAQRAGSNC
jgi:hypothetical protein